MATSQAYADISNSRLDQAYMGGPGLFPNHEEVVQPRSLDKPSNKEVNMAYGMFLKKFGYESTDDINPSPTPQQLSVLRAAGYKFGQDIDGVPYSSSDFVAHLPRNTPDAPQKGFQVRVNERGYRGGHAWVATVHEVCQVVFDNAGNEMYWQIDKQGSKPDWVRKERVFDHSTGPISIVYDAGNQKIGATDEERLEADTCSELDDMLHRIRFVDLSRRGKLNGHIL